MDELPVGMVVDEEQDPPPDNSEDDEGRGGAEGSPGDLLTPGLAPSDEDVEEAQGRNEADGTNRETRDETQVREEVPGACDRPPVLRDDACADRAHLIRRAPDRGGERRPEHADDAPDRREDHYDHEDHDGALAPGARRDARPCEQVEAERRHGDRDDRRERHARGGPPGGREVGERRCDDKRREERSDPLLDFFERHVATHRGRDSVSAGVGDSDRGAHSPRFDRHDGETRTHEPVAPGAHPLEAAREAFEGCDQPEAGDSCRHHVPREGQRDEREERGPADRYSPAAEAGDEEVDRAGDEWREQGDSHDHRANHPPGGAVLDLKRDHPPGETGDHPPEKESGDGVGREDRTHQSRSPVGDRDRNEGEYLATPLPQPREERGVGRSSGGRGGDGSGRGSHHGGARRENSLLPHLIDDGQRHAGGEPTATEDP